VRTILRTTKGTYCTLGGRGQTPVSGTPLLGCATPPGQSPAVTLLWDFDERLSGLLPVQKKPVVPCRVVELSLELLPGILITSNE